MKPLPSLRLAPRHAAYGRCGVTMVELLIAITVIGLLMAILIPAVQSSRQSSRQVQCLHRLKELGLAIGNYESDKREYPDGMKWRVQILPYVDEAPLADQFELMSEWHASGGHGAPAEWRLKGPIEQFVCPVDHRQGHATVNYYANIGSGLQADGFNGLISPESGGAFYFGAHGVRHTSGITSATDMTDGLSNTVALSEALTGRIAVGIRASDVSRELLLRTLWKRGGTALIRREDYPEVVRLCETVQAWDAPAATTDRGHSSWPAWEPASGGLLLGPIIYGWAYEHASPPNSPSCGASYWGVYSANSLHVGGVNAVFGDGHARFISESIGRDVWRAQGTRSGNEVNTF